MFQAFLMENMEWQLYVVQDGPFQKMQAEQSGDLCGPKPVLPRLVANFLQNPTRNLVQVNQFTVWRGDTFIMMSHFQKKDTVIQVISLSISVLFPHSIQIKLIIDQQLFKLK